MECKDFFSEMTYEVGRALIFGAWIGLGIHTLGSGYFYLEKFTTQIRLKSCLGLSITK
jgi:hypothetical protein